MPEQPEPVEADIRLLETAFERGMMTANQLRLALDAGGSVCDVAVEQNFVSAADIELLRPLAEPDTFLPGYEFEELIGQGATGTVYRARHKNLDRRVALKLLKLSAQENQIASARSQVEAKVGASLQHPNIVTVHDRGIHQQRTYIAMELVEGESVLEMIERERKLPPALALRLIQQVVSALSYAADEGIVHRDIKPANLMLTDAVQGLSLPDGVPAVKVTDFGLAFQRQNVESTRLTAAGATLGTPCYVAPEQLVDSDVDLRADIYALGASLAHMVTGQQPFGEANAFHAIAAKMQGDQDWRKIVDAEMSDSVRQLIFDMTEHLPDERIQTYDELRDRITSLHGDTSPATARRRTGEDRAKPGASRTVWSRLIPGVLLMIAVLALLGGIYSWYASPRDVPVAVDVETVNRQYLFDGASVPLGDFKGNWLVDVDAENAPVLSGSNGWKAFPTDKFQSGRSDYLRFQIGTNPLIEAQTDICFAIDVDGMCAIIRLAKGVAQLGEGMLGTDKFTPADNGLESNLLIADDGPRYQLVIIERQEQGWFPRVNNKSLGAVRTSPNDNERIVVRVSNGTTHFDNIQLSETRPVAASEVEPAAKDK